MISKDEDRSPDASDVPPHQQPPRSGQASGELSQAFIDQVHQSLLELRLGTHETIAHRRSQYFVNAWGRRFSRSTVDEWTQKKVAREREHCTHKKWTLKYNFNLTVVRFNVA